MKSEMINYKLFFQSVTKKLISRSALLFLTMSFILSLSSCVEEQKTFHIGILFDKGGTRWQENLDAAIWAIEKANKSSSAISNNDAIRFTYSVKFCGEGAGQAMEAARELIFTENAAAIIGPNTTRAALPVSLVATNTNTPMITDGSTHLGTTASKPYVFSVVLTNQQMVKAILRYFKMNESNKKIAILFDKSNVYSRNIYKLMIELSKENRNQITAFEYTQSNKDFEGLLRSINSKGYDYLLLPNFIEDLNPQMKIVSRLKMKSEIILTDSWDFDTHSELADDQAVIVATITHPYFFGTNSVAQKFELDFKARHLKTPSMGAAISYDAVTTLINAVRRTDNQEPEEIKKELEKTNSEGVTGKIYFDSEGNLNRPVILFKVTNRSIDPLKETESKIAE